MISIPGSVDWRLKPVVTLLAAWLLLLSFAVQAQEVGRFQFVHGTVDVQRNGATLKAQREMVIHEGDTLVTAAASSAQLRMVDGALLALRPRSELKIEAYRFQDADSDTSLVNLARGSLRSVTGALGHARPDNVKIETPVATMGIRGTDMDTFVPPPVEGQDEPPEAVLRVNSGRGTMASAGVLLEVPAGSIAQVVEGEVPRFVPALPRSARALEGGNNSNDSDETESRPGAMDQDSVSPSLGELGIRELPEAMNRGLQQDGVRVIIK